MSQKVNLKGFLFVYSSQAAYNTYRDLLLSNIVSNILLLDLTEFSGYSIHRNKEIINEIKLFKPSIKNIYPRLIKQSIILLKFKHDFSKIINKYSIKHVVIEIDKEPIYLQIIKYCNGNSIRTTCFQHGLYSSDSIEYEKNVFNQRFSCFNRILYKILRAILDLTNVFPSRKPLGQNGASQYFFYSKYYKDMFLRAGAKSDKIKIVGPTKYSNLKKKNKEKLIVYANMLFEKWYTHLGISDKVVLKTIIDNLPNGYKFIIKPHPSEKRDEYESIINSVLINSSQVNILEPNDNIEAFLSKAEILITYQSSIIFDAIYLDTLVIILNLSEFGLPAFMGEELLSLTLKHINDGSLLKIVERKEELNTQIKHQSIFFNRHLGDKINNNIETFINQLIEN